MKCDRRRPSSATSRSLRFAGVIAVALSLSSCAIFKLKSDLEVLYTEGVFVPGQINVDSSLVGQPIVLLAESSPTNPTATGLRLVDYRFPDGRHRFNFQIRTGEYRLMAFIDQNGDFIYQPGEPSMVQPGAAIANRIDTQSGQWQFNILEMPATPAGEGLPIEVDLSPAGLPNIERTATTMGVPIDFESFRFDKEHVAMGMWEPTRWYTEVDYGFYLFGDWEQSANEPMLLMVHGINGSPRDFRKMLKKLDATGYKVALYHYPSGLSINDNAYMLAQIMNELQIRSPGQEYVLLAHSMGGLVTKRFIQLEERSGRAELIKHYITISTPWAGHAAAAAGAEYSPVVAPVWKDMAPSSEFIRKLGEYALPESLEYALFFGYGGHKAVLMDSNDGVVSIESQLFPPMQDRARVLIGVPEDHEEILRADRTLTVVTQLLEEARQQMTAAR